MLQGMGKKVQVPGWRPNEQDLFHSAQALVHGKVNGVRARALHNVLACLLLPLIPEKPTVQEVVELLEAAFDTRADLNDLVQEIDDEDEPPRKDS
jgi:hypothetical protein